LWLVHARSAVRRFRPAQDAGGSTRKPTLP
jgi:hypothetical protein